MIDTKAFVREPFLPGERMLYYFPNVENCSLELIKNTPSSVFSFSIGSLVKYRVTV